MQFCDTADYKSALRRWRSFVRHVREGNAVGAGGDVVREPDFPLALAVVHTEKKETFARRMVGGRLHEDKIRPHMCNADGRAVDDQPHLYLGGMCTVTLLRDHE